MKIFKPLIKNFVIHNSKFLIHNLLIITTFIFFSGCVKYAFSDANTGSAKTLVIRNFYNDGGGGPANLSQVFTEKLKEYYQQNSKLTLIRAGGDWELDGRITGWTVAPIAPTDQGTAALNRLTIRVSVTFTNHMEGPQEIKGFENKEFSFYQDFKQSQSLSSVEAELIDFIINRLVLDIFNATTSNW